MRKKLYFLVFSILMISFTNVRAASICSYSEQASLNSEAANIKAKYTEKTGILDASDVICELGDSCETEYNYFEISVLNLTPNFYIVVISKNDNSKKVIRYSDVKDGIASFDFKGIMNINTFTFDVYSSKETGCPDEKYQTFRLKTPRKNIYANYVQCEENPDYAMCQKYVDFEDTGFYDFTQKIEKYEVEQEKKTEENKVSFIQKTIDFIKENKIPVIIITGILIIGVGTTTFVIIKKRKKSVL